MKIDEVIDERYKLIKKIGDGGFGDVYEVVDLESGNKYALKYCRETDEGPIGRFKREVRIMAKLDHPNVIKLIAVNLDYSPPYFVMPLAKENVEKLSATLRGNMPTLLNIFKKICEGVKAIHDAGALHRDINPRNVLHFEDGKIVVSDLGFGRNIDRKSEIHDSSKYGNGTPLYVAPEQKIALENADQRTDIYQLGKTLQALFSGNPAAMDTTQVPPGIVHIIRKATAYNPVSRYQSVQELLAYIDAYLSRFDPEANYQLAFENAKNSLKQSISQNNLNVEKCLNAIDLMVESKMSPIEFISNFDQIPVLALKYMAQNLDTELEQLLNLYEQYLVSYRQEGVGREFEYAEVISDRMKRIYENTANLDFKARCLKIILQNALWYNRYSVMDDFNYLLGQIKSDDEAFAIAQMLKEETDNYSRIYERVSADKLHFYIRQVQAEIKEREEEANKIAPKAWELPSEY